MSECPILEKRGDDINALNREVGSIHTKVDLILDKMDDIDRRTTRNTTKVDKIYAWATGVGMTFGALTAAVFTYGSKILNSLGRFVG